MIPNHDIDLVIEMIEEECNRDDAPDCLLALIHEFGPVTQEQADRIMIAARAIDPTESNYAAEVRDTIRDNCEGVTI